MKQSPQHSGVHGRKIPLFFFRLTLYHQGIHSQGPSVGRYQQGIYIDLHDIGIFHRRPGYSHKGRGQHAAIGGRFSTEFA